MSNLSGRVALVLAFSVGLSAAAFSEPVIYTLRTVADGRLGEHDFKQALVTIRMESDTSSVQKRPGSNGGTLYTNIGHTSVSILSHGTTIKARFAPGEVYVRYDARAGIAGFGSGISENYPFAVGCDNDAYPSASTYVKDCAQGDWGPNLPVSYTDRGTANVLASVAFYGGGSYTASLLGLPMTLSETTLLTGTAHSCATVYTPNQIFGGGELGVCSAAAPRALRTDHGGLYFQDTIGGTLSPPNPFGDFWSGWPVANVASLQVEVLQEASDD